MSKSGVQEWAKHSINLQYTCEYNCRYCYAKKMNKRFNFKVKEPIIKKYNGVIMFPTMHDITLSNFDKVSDTIEKLLEFDNKILIVSKMDSEVARAFAEKFVFHPKKLNLEFRITITSDREHIKDYFENKAPTDDSRWISEKILTVNDFNVSLSIEPLLHIGAIAEATYIANDFKKLKSIWVGCLTNYKLNPDIPEEKAVIDLYKTLPEIYEEYRKYDFIKFKDSFFKAMDREIKRRKIGGSK
jgi:DNA repair photolyase